MALLLTSPILAMIVLLQLLMSGISIGIPALLARAAPVPLVADHLTGFLAENKNGGSVVMLKTTAKFPSNSPTLRYRWIDSQVARGREPRVAEAIKLSATSSCRSSDQAW